MYLRRLAISVSIALVYPIGMIVVGAVFGVITAAVLAVGLLPAGYVEMFIIVAVMNAAAGMLVVRCPCYVR